MRAPLPLCVSCGQQTQPAPVEIVKQMTDEIIRLFGGNFMVRSAVFMYITPHAVWRLAWPYCVRCRLLQKRT